jgi:hypothetical protein
MRPFTPISDPAPLQTTTFQEVALSSAQVTKCFEEGLFLADLSGRYPRNAVQQWDFGTRKFPFFKVDFKKEGVFEGDKELDMNDAFPS